MGKDTTIYEVAERAGVSISTVSNAVNRPERVSARTRQRVLAVADELGFVPKVQAVSLAQRGLGRIGVVAPFSSYSSYGRRLTGVLQAFRDGTVEVSVFDQPSAAAAASPVLASIPVRGRVDGLIVMGEPIEASIERRLVDRGLPVVVVDSTSDHFPSVVVDDFEGGRLAATHLLSLGHRRFGYLLEQQASDYPSQARSRLDGFRHELGRVTGCTLEVEACHGTFEAAHAAAAALLRRASPTAVMTHFDDLAVGVIRAADDAGLRVPGDLSVMGYDDGPVAAAVMLTTVRQPFEESGSVAAGQLRLALAGPVTRATTVLQLEVVVRATTAPPPPGP